jgi:hypothetical protein
MESRAMERGQLHLDESLRLAIDLGSQHVAVQLDREQASLLASMLIAFSESQSRQAEPNKRAQRR